MRYCASPARTPAGRHSPGGVVCAMRNATTLSGSTEVRLVLVHRMASRIFIQAISWCRGRCFRKGGGGQGIGGGDWNNRRVIATKRRRRWWRRRRFRRRKPARWMAWQQAMMDGCICSLLLVVVMVVRMALSSIETVSPTMTMQDGSC
jgi:hypothetical protein